jgi:sulfite reductase (ferredoxin)
MSHSQLIILLFLPVAVPRNMRPDQCSCSWQDLVNDETSISGDSAQLMKFHGSYQQDDRERRTKGQGKFYQFMMRTRQPAGHVTNQLYKVMDDLADLVSETPLLETCVTSVSQQLHAKRRQLLQPACSSAVVQRS